jgi:hypothetical protein
MMAGLISVQVHDGKRSDGMPNLNHRCTETAALSLFFDSNALQSRKSETFVA